MRWLLMLVTVGCGGGSLPMSNMDASRDVDGDGSGDADMDGVPDGIDVCPGVFDPGQVDLDGDHVGWMCDPVETFTLSASPGLTHHEFALNGYTMAGVVTHTCPSATDCHFDVVSIGARGSHIINSDAASASEAWVKNRFNGHPVVTADGQVIWSPYGPSSVGMQDLATGAFAAQYEGDMSGVVTARGEPIALLDTTRLPTISTRLLEPRPNGVLANIGSSPGWMETQGSVGPQSADSSMPVALIPTEAPDGYALKSFSPGEGSLKDVQAGGAPLTQLSALEAIRAVEHPMPFCATRNGTNYFVEPGLLGVVSGVLPLPSCFGLESLLFKERDLRFVRTTSAAAYVQHGVVHPLFTGLPDGNLTTYPGDVSAAMHEVFGSQLQTVWAVDPDGSSHLIGTDLKNAQVSIAGQTVHVAALRGTALVLLRYHAGGQVQEVTVTPYLSPPIQLLTTHEGAALVGSNPEMFVVPSQTMTPATIDLADLHGGVRGGYTVLTARRTAPTSLPALYAYDEVAGAPRLTMLSPEINGTYMLLLDAPGMPPSEWFAFFSSSLGACQFARMTSAGTTPALTSLAPCRAGTALFVVGMTSDDKIVVSEGSDRYTVYLLGTTAAAMVADATEGVTIDEWQGSHRVVAWEGHDQTGGFICMASQPERCWTRPALSGTYVSGRWGVGGAPDMFMNVNLTSDGFAQTITVIKSIGPGNRAQPVP